MIERVLNISGLGELVHPVYGTLQVKSTTYSVSSNQSNIGQFRFSLNFQISEEVVSPSPSVLISTAEASKDAESTRTALDDAFETTYYDPQLPETLDASATKLDGIYDSISAAIEEAITGVDSIQNKVAEFTKIVSDGKALVFTAAQQAATVKTALIDLYSSALSVVSLPQDLFSACDPLIDFGFLESEGKTNTVPRAREESNRRILNEHTQTTALINLYEAAVYKDYQTDVEIDETRTLLNNAYTDQINQISDEISPEPAQPVIPLAADPEVRTTIAQLRTTVNKILNEKEQNIWRVVTISPGKSSMLLTAYRYYGNLDTLSILQGLNLEVNSANFNEEISMVSK